MRFTAATVLFLLCAGALCLTPAGAQYQPARRDAIRRSRAVLRGEGALVKVSPPQDTPDPAGRHFVQSVEFFNYASRYRLTYDVIRPKDRPDEVTSGLWAFQSKYVTLGMPGPSSANWYCQGFLTWEFDDESLYNRLATMRVVREAGPDAAVEYSWDTPKVRATLRFVLPANGDKLLMLGRYEPKGKVTRSTLRLMAFPATFDKPYNRALTTAARTVLPDAKVTLDLAKERWLLCEDTTAERPASGSAGLLLGTPASFRAVNVDVGNYPIFLHLELAPDKRDFALAFYDQPALPDVQETRRYFREQADAEADLLQRLAARPWDEPAPANAWQGRKTRLDYTPVHDHKPAPADGELTAGDLPGSVVLFARDYTEPVFPSSLPRRAEITDTFSLKACAGEFEPVTLCLHTRDAAATAVLALGDDFLGPAGTRISRRHVDARAVGYAARWHSGGERQRLPLFLDRLARDPSREATRFEPVAIPRGETVRFWLTVRVPEGAPAGRYTMPIRLSLSTGETLPARLLLDVRPFALKKPEIAFGMYHAAMSLPTSKQTREHQRLVFRDMAEHGMTSLAIMYLIPNQGSLEVCNAPFTGVIPMMEDLAAAGFGPKAPIIAATTQKAEERKAMMALSRQRGWPPWLFYAIDEPGHGGKAVVEMCRKLCEEWKAKIPSIRHTTALYHKTDVTEGGLGAALDVWIYHVTTLDPELMALNRKLGKEMWTYDCVFGPANPESSRMHYGLYTWALGLKGAFKWVYQDCGNSVSTRTGVYLPSLVPAHNSDENPWMPDFSPWEIFDEERRDELGWQFSYTYPGAVGPEPTTGWELVREGVDDYRYLITLEDALARARKSHPKGEAVARAGGLLARLRAAIKPGVTYSGPPLKPEHLVTSGIPLAEYSRMREQVAESIVGLRLESDQ